MCVFDRFVEYYVQRGRVCVQSFSLLHFCSRYSEIVGVADPV